MAQLTKTVDKTLVNGSEVFIYTMNAAYSGLEQPALEGKITDFFPSKIKYILPPVGGQIQSITETPVFGGTQVTFNLGSVHAGTSLSFTIACSFGPGRVDNDSFTNAAELFADDFLVAQATAPTVHLELDENFVMTKFAQPSNIVNPGEEITFILSLTNNNDPGAAITNVVVTDTLPPQLTPVLSFTPVGQDVPSGGYSDPSANGLTGSWVGNTMTFVLPSYNGARYDITFKVRVADDVTPGQMFSNMGRWTVNGVGRNDASLILSVYDPERDAFGLFKAGTRTTLVGAPMEYGLVNSNMSGMTLSNYVLDDTLPNEVDITSFRLAAGTGLVNYSIFIALESDPAVFIPVVQNVPSGPYPLTDLTPLIPPGDRIVIIRLTAQNLLPTGSSHTLSLFGVTNSTAVSGTSFINTATATSGSVSRTAQWRTDVNGASDLSVTKSFNPNLPAYYPLEEFEVTVQGGAPNTITVEPILIDLMPTALRYVMDSEYFLYYDIVTGITYDSRQPGFPVPLPTRAIIPNFSGTGRMLLRWSFFGFILPSGGRISVVFRAFVEIEPPSTFVNEAYEGMPGNNTLFVYNERDDPLDLDNDGLTTTDRLSYAELPGVILTTSEFSLQKQVKGESDLAFSSAGTTVSGGNIEYRLLVTNNQSIELRDIEIVDILPHVGDTGVILINQPRDSQFDVYATSVVTAEIVNLVGDPVDPDPDIVIEYSTSNDPIRFDALGNTIGTGTWSLTPPVDITTLRSIKVTTGPTVVLRPYDRLIISFGAKAPVGVPVGRIAYNSFAVRANKITSGGLEPMLPTEPNKVSVRIVGSGLGSIGDFVWNDLNENGLYEPTEPGVNGVTVELYSEAGVLLATTVTANDANGNPGYYLFTGLPDGVYRVRFIPFGSYVLTQQESAQPNGSKPDPATGFTPYITISNGQQILDIDAGLIDEACVAPVINASDRCIHVGSVFDPMEGVTATDCSGNDITDLVVVTFNNVDTEVPGLYCVSYQVTDSGGQTAEAFILVMVCQNGPRQQAITDLIESVALQQAAITHILNAEGEKLQRADELELPPEELLEVSSSVEEMFRSVTRLEMILLAKLELFQDCECGGDCCDVP